MAWSDALAAQYDAATTAIGVVRLDGWTTLRIAGADRASFLHNMCTNDIRSLRTGDQTEAFLTDVKGKIVGHVVVLTEADALLLITVPNQADNLIAHLGRYIIREDVQIEDLSSVICWSLAIGLAASQAIASLPDDALRAQCPQIWPVGYWLGAAEGMAPSLGKVVPCDSRVWHALRIESGWPLFGVDFDSSNLPQEVGRDAQALSFRKGCYLGQETIARIDALGHVNKRLATVRFACDEPLSPGAELTADGLAAGHVTSSSWSPKLGRPLGLAMIRRGFNEPGAQLVCSGQAAEVILTPAVAHLTPGQ